MSDSQRQIILDCKNTFSTPCGQRILHYLQVFCGGHCNQENFNAESPTRTAYNLGKNRVYRQLVSMIECDIEAANSGQDCLIETGEQ